MARATAAPLQPRLSLGFIMKHGIIKFMCLKQY